METVFLPVEFANVIRAGEIIQWIQNILLIYAGRGLGGISNNHGNGKEGQSIDF